MLSGSVCSCGTLSADAGFVKYDPFLFPHLRKHAIRLPLSASRSNCMAGLLMDDNVKFILLSATSNNFHIIHQPTKTIVRLVARRLMYSIHHGVEAATCPNVPFRMPGRSGTLH